MGMHWWLLVGVGLILYLAFLDAVVGDDVRLAVRSWRTEMNGHRACVDCGRRARYHTHDGHWHWCPNCYQNLW